MLEIDPEKVARIIFLSRRLYDRGGTGDRDTRREDLASVEAELRACIGNLEAEEQASLVALMWVGRGSFDVRELEEAMVTAQEEAPTPTADYLIGTPHLSDHLETGLEALGYPVGEIEDGIL